ncbi:MAG TPA: acetate/propionate family kinase [Myxococcales bacterium]|nr:acetate/propionate family kinase [Myxococcales bacterium]
MLVLVINCGSSSIKADLVDSRSGKRSARARVERVATESCFVRWDDGPADALGDVDHRGAIAKILSTLVARAGEVAIDVVGHRVVHGGADFTDSVLITDQVVAQIEAVSPLAPLHNPPNLAGIRAARSALPEATHVAVFDTSFHASMPPKAYKYAIDQQVAKVHSVRRYGFHGTSHRWVAQQAALWMEAPAHQLRIITCHLGNGASVCAVERGRSVETSMGMTPLEGLVMGTRSGDLDAGAVLHLMDAMALSVSETSEMLNRRSGLLGLSGLSHDLRDVEAQADAGDERCRDAIDVYAHRIRKYIGAYAAVMGGVDVIVFTGGVGENSAQIRRLATDQLSFLGAVVDHQTNHDCDVCFERPVFEISTKTSRVKVVAIATDEERAIAQDAAQIHQSLLGDEVSMAIPIAISARHVHLSREAVNSLFGEDHQLTPLRALSQPGQFACQESVDLIGPKRTIERVRVLGPIRSNCQIEVSRTDEFTLGVDAPVRRSGDVAGSSPITLKGPAGSLSLSEGLICAWRHIHMTPTDALRFGVDDGDVVEVRVDTDGRDLIFGDVLVRVSPNYRLEMHIDTDEGNAAELSPGDSGILTMTGATAHLRKGKLS